VVTRSTTRRETLSMSSTQTLRHGELSGAPWTCKYSALCSHIGLSLFWFFIYSFHNHVVVKQEREGGRGETNQESMNKFSPSLFLIQSVVPYRVTL
jgi:hypothetical protein